MSIIDNSENVEKFKEEIDTSKIQINKTNQTNPTNKHYKKTPREDTPDEDSTETTADASDDIVPASLPITPMADLSANQVHKDELRSFAGFDVSKMDLTEGVLAEAVSANGEKVVITE